MTSARKAMCRERLERRVWRRVSVLTVARTTPGEEACRVGSRLLAREVRRGVAHLVREGERVARERRGREGPELVHRRSRSSFTSLLP